MVQESHRERSNSVSLSRSVDCVIPPWSAGIQADRDVTGRILANLPAIHAGMTSSLFSCSAGGRKLMTNFV
jgi:hypothetical protein